MKQQLLLFFSLLVMSTFTFAQKKDSLSQEEKERREKNIQAGNPFKKYGYTPKIATLSDGKYLEFHDLDSVVIIGSVYYNRVTKKVIDFVERDMTNPDAQPLSDVRGRWLSPDPLSEEAPNWTPYRFGFNNPIYFNDPTGLFEDDYQLHDDGSVTLIQKTDDKSDTLYASNSNGSVDKSRSVTVQKEKASDSSVIGELSSNIATADDSSFSKGIRSGSTSNVADAFNVYSFVAKNSGVEWGMDAYNNGDGFNFDIYTGHNKSLTPSFFDYSKNSLKNLAFSFHSHKNRLTPSFDGYNRGDFDADQAKNRLYLKAIGKDKSQLDYHDYPPAYLLYAPDKGNMNLYRYKGIPGSTTGNSTNLGTVTAGSISSQVINP